MATERPIGNNDVKLCAPGANEALMPPAFFLSCSNVFIDYVTQVHDAHGPF